MSNFTSARKGAGFTLIEVMIAVAIIGILAAIAYPSYQEYINKSRRAEAQVALLELSQFLERHYTAKGGYLINGTSGGSGPVLPFTKAPRDGTQEFYTLSLNAVTARTYTLQAAPKNGMAGDKCGTFTLTNTGKKAVSGGTAGTPDCWKR